MDCNTSDWMLSEFRLSKAYVRLCTLPDDGPETSVSLASIGNHEVRMLAGPEPLFWLELFDHSMKTSVDSFRCHRLKDAVPVFSDFVAQANVLNRTGETS